MDFGRPKCTRLGTSVLFLDYAIPHALPVQQRLWRAAAIARASEGVREAVVGDGNLTILHAPQLDAEALGRALEPVWDAPAVDRVEGVPIEVPVRYDGADLEAIAAACGLTVDATIALHAGANYTVSFVGFQPGFAYLEGLDARLHLPRRDRPRTRVPAGSVAIANGYSAVYPLESPGGWNLLGSTMLALFDPARDPFALLAPGDCVRFVRA